EVLVVGHLRFGLACPLVGRGVLCDGGGGRRDDDEGQRDEEERTIGHCFLLEISSQRARSVARCNDQHMPRPQLMQRSTRSLSRLSADGIIPTVAGLRRIIRTSSPAFRRILCRTPPR